MNTWTDQEIQSFRIRLAQVIAWTAKLAKDFDPILYGNGRVFRQTNPIFRGQPFYNFDGEYATWNQEWFEPGIYTEVLEIAVKARSAEGIPTGASLEELGRIISVQTCISTADGAPIIESNHFVDECDIPPIDTWFYLKEGYYHDGYRCSQVLFCWIPAAFVPLMQGAIEVEILDSYRWTDENDPVAYERIAQQPLPLVS